jgi:peptidoglycan/xylan/chitin deacetylase (PgdA/CDA1 family)
LEKLTHHLAHRPRVAVLMYHEVLPDQHDCPSWLVVRESDFERQMRHLHTHYEVVPIDTLANGYFGENERPVVAITFDDGYSGNAVYAAPILKNLHIPFTVYVATSRIESGGRYWYDDVISALISAPGPVDFPTSRGTLRYAGASASNDVARWSSINAVLFDLKTLPDIERNAIAASLAEQPLMPSLRMMTPAEVRDLASDPLCTIGNHTNGHELLDQLRGDEAYRSIQRAQELLIDWTGLPPRHFSYPNGNYLPEHCELVSTLGFSTAVTTKPGIWNRTKSIYEIPRVGIGRFDNFNLFRAKLSGLLV